MSAAADQRRKFPWGLYWLALVAILVLALWPGGSVALSGWLAAANGCVLNEGDIHPCNIGGADWGGALYTMFVMGWFMLATLPLGAAALLVWAVVLAVHLLVRRRTAE